MNDKLKRDLLPTLKDLMDDLIKLDTDVAKLEIKDSIYPARRIKAGLLEHTRKCDDFKRQVEEIRKQIEKNK
jgi:hypothetical protein